MSDPAHALTQRYYDGEVTPDEEAAALDHLGTCAACQRELAEWMALDAAASEPRPSAPPAARPPAPVIPIARARRRGWVAAAAVVVAAAAAAVIWLALRPAPGPAAPPRLALAETRAVEVRVGDPTLDRHRPLRVDRGGGGGEPIALAALAALETRAPAMYRGALVLSRDLDRARAALANAPSDTPSDVDRAALRVLSGDPIGAIIAADRALARGPAPAARWNRALAMRELGLVRSAARELAAIAELGEPGWSAEARTLADGLLRPIEDRDRARAAFAVGEQQLLAGTGALDAALATRFPGEARVALYDALRSADTPAAARALTPLAAAIDAATGGDGAQRAVTRIANADFAVRARFAPRYRQLVLGALDAAATTRLLDELDRAGPAAADISFGAIVLAGASDARATRLAALAQADGDPWLGLYVERDRARRQRAGGDLAGSEATLRRALAGCPPSVAYRCGNLALDLTAQLIASQRLADAAAAAQTARAAFIASGTPSLAAVALGHLGDVERLRARFGPMAVYLDEYLAEAPTDCERRAFVELERATAAYWQGDAAGTRAHLPEPGACDVAPSPPQVMVAVDLARFTDDAGDRARAEATLARLGDDPMSRLIAAAGAGRLAIAIARDPARAELDAAITAAQAIGDSANASEFRAWAFTTLIDDAGRHGDGAAALALFARELALPAVTGCVLAASLDDDRITTIARAADAAPIVHHARIAAMLAPTSAEVVPTTIAAALARCPTIAVIARPPLHGRADLLPADRVWSFVSQRAAAAPTAGPSVIVRDPVPPRELGLPRVGTVAIERTGDQVIAGVDATPARVLAALTTASYIELHVHGLVDLGRAEASLLALSPDADGRFALTASAVAGATLTAHPIVILAACRAAEASPLINRRWGLPDAFLAAGARAVIAAGAPIPDDQAPGFFASLRARLAAGATPAQAVAAERAAGTEPWRAKVMVFE